MNIPYWLALLAIAAMTYVATEFVIWAYRELRGDRRKTITIVVKRGIGGYQPKGSMNNSKPPGED